MACDQASLEALAAEALPSPQPPPAEAVDYLAAFLDDRARWEAASHKARGKKPPVET